MKIDLHYNQDPPFGPLTHQMSGIGGTENFATNVVEYLARAGHEVRMFNKTFQPNVAEYTGGGMARWHTLGHFEPLAERDVLISFRMREVFQQHLPNTKLKVLILADTESHGLGVDVRDNRIDFVMAVGEWQWEKIQREELIPINQMVVASNGVAMEKFDRDRSEVERVPGKCVHLSTPERGMEPLLDMWPSIQEQVPYATLHLFSSFKGWGVSDDDNKAMTEGLYARILTMQAEGYQIENHVHVNEGTMRREMLSAQLMLYPTRHFDETCCISALESSAAGLPIVATKRAALAERVVNDKTGFSIGQCAEHHDQQFVGAVTLLLEDKETWQRMSNASVEYARDYDYAKLIPAWVERWSNEIALRR